MADCIIEVNQGEIKTYPGGLDYYLLKKDNNNNFAQIVNSGLKQKDKTKKTEKNKKQEASVGVMASHKRLTQARERLIEIKKEAKALKKEKVDLEAESYVKARILSEPFKARDPQALKEYGQRLKFIQKRIRAINGEISKLIEERIKINKA